MAQVAGTSFSLIELEKAFLEDPKRGHEQMRAWKSEHRAEFLREAIQLLEAGAGNSFSQLLLQMCREDSSGLSQMLTTADLLSLDEAARLLRISSKNDPTYQINLISKVKAEIDLNGAGLPNSEFSRLLEILSRSVDQEKLGGMLSSLAEHPDERVRSKVAVIAVGSSRIPAHKAGWMKDEDPRVRANAVESLWGRRDPEAIQILKSAWKDPHHRIAANALYGLYLAGEPCSIRGVLRLFREVEVPRQLAGIWLLGQTGDPRFLNLVHDNLALKTGRVKFALLNAGRRIKKNLEALREKPKLQFQMVHFERAPKGRVRCGFLLRKPEGDLLGANELQATQVLIQDGDLRIDQFHFEPRGGSDPAHVALAIPLRVGLSNAYASRLVSAVENALEGRREKDCWAIHKYRLNASSPTETGSISFTNSNSVLAQEQLRSVRAAAPGLSEAIEELASKFPAQSSRRILVGLLDPEAELPASPPPALRSLLERHGITLNLVCCRDLDEDSLREWRQLCLSRHGALLMARNVEQLPQLFTQLAGGFAEHFYVTYQLGRNLPNPDPRERIQLEFIPAAGYGKVVLEGEGEIVAEAAGLEQLAD